MPTSIYNASVLQTISKLLETQNQNQLPPPDLGLFNHDPLKYPIWFRAFKTLVESRTVNPAERLHLLGQYVPGDAKAVIQSEKAKKMLSKRYGDPFINISISNKTRDFIQNVQITFLWISKFTTKFASRLFLRNSNPAM